MLFDEPATQVAATKQAVSLDDGDEKPAPPPPPLAQVCDNEPLILEGNNTFSQISTANVQFYDGEAASVSVINDTRQPSSMGKELTSAKSLSELEQLKEYIMALEQRNSELEQKLSSNNNNSNAKDASSTSLSDSQLNVSGNGLEPQAPIPAPDVIPFGPIFDPTAAATSFQAGTSPFSGPAPLQAIPNIHQGGFIITSSGICTYVPPKDDHSVTAPRNDHIDFDTFLQSQQSTDCPPNTSDLTSLLFNTPSFQLNGSVPSTAIQSPLHVSTTTPDKPKGKKKLTKKAAAALAALAPSTVSTGTPTAYILSANGQLVPVSGPAPAPLLIAAKQHGGTIAIQPKPTISQNNMLLPMLAKTKKPSGKSDSSTKKLSAKKQQTTTVNGTETSSSTTTTVLDVSANSSVTSTQLTSTPVSSAVTVSTTSATNNPSGVSTTTTAKHRAIRPKPPSSSNLLAPVTNAPSFTNSLAPKLTATYMPQSLANFTPIKINTTEATGNHDLLASASSMIFEMSPSHFNFNNLSPSGAQLRALSISPGKQQATTGTIGPTPQTVQFVQALSGADASSAKLLLCSSNVSTAAQPTSTVTSPAKLPISRNNSQTQLTTQRKLAINPGNTDESTSTTKSNSKPTKKTASKKQLAASDDASSSPVVKCKKSKKATKQQQQQAAASMLAPPVNFVIDNATPQGVQLFGGANFAPLMMNGNNGTSCGGLFDLERIMYQLDGFGSLALQGLDTSASVPMTTSDVFPSFDATSIQLQLQQLLSGMAAVKTTTTATPPISPKLNIHIEKTPPKTPTKVVESPRVAPTTEIRCASPEIMESMPSLDQFFAIDTTNTTSVDQQTATPNTIKTTKSTKKQMKKSDSDASTKVKVKELFPKQVNGESKTTPTVSPQKKILPKAASPNTSISSSQLLLADLCTKKSSKTPRRDKNLPRPCKVSVELEKAERAAAAESAKKLVEEASVPITSSTVPVDISSGSSVAPAPSDVINSGGEIKFELSDLGRMLDQVEAIPVVNNNTNNFLFELMQLGASPSLTTPSTAVLSFNDSPTTPAINKKLKQARAKLRINDDASLCTPPSLLPNQKKTNQVGHIKQRMVDSVATDAKSGTVKKTYSKLDDAEMFSFLNTSSENDISQQSEALKEQTNKTQRVPLQASDNKLQGNVTTVSTMESSVGNVVVAKKRGRPPKLTTTSPESKKEVKESKAALYLKKLEATLGQKSHDQQLVDCTNNRSEDEVVGLKSHLTLEEKRKEIVVSDEEEDDVVVNSLQVLLDAKDGEEDVIEVSTVDETSQLTERGTTTMTVRENNEDNDSQQSSQLARTESTADDMSLLENLKHFVYDIAIDDKQNELQNELDDLSQTTQSDDDKVQEYLKPVAESKTSVILSKRKRTTTNVKSTTKVAGKTTTTGRTTMNSVSAAAGPLVSLGRKEKSLASKPKRRRSNTHSSTHDDNDTDESDEVEDEKPQQQPRRTKKNSLSSTSSSSSDSESDDSVANYSNRRQKAKAVTRNKISNRSKGKTVNKVTVTSNNKEAATGQKRRGRPPKVVSESSLAVKDVADFFATTHRKTANSLSAVSLDAVVAFTRLETESRRGKQKTNEVKTTTTTKLKGRTTRQKRRDDNTPSTSKSASDEENESENEPVLSSSVSDTSVVPVVPIDEKVNNEKEEEEDVSMSDLDEPPFAPLRKEVSSEEDDDPVDLENEEERCSRRRMEEYTGHKVKGIVPHEPKHDEEEEAYDDDMYHNEKEEERKDDSGMGKLTPPENDGDESSDVDSLDAPVKPLLMGDLAMKCEERRLRSMADSDASYWNQHGDEHFASSQTIEEHNSGEMVQMQQDGANKNSGHMTITPPATVSSHHPASSSSTNSHQLIINPSSTSSNSSSTSSAAQISPMSISDTIPLQPTSVYGSTLPTFFDTNTSTSVAPTDSFSTQYGTGTPYMGQHVATSPMLNNLRTSHSVSPQQMTSNLTNNNAMNVSTENLASYHNHQPMSHHSSRSHSVAPPLTPMTPKPVHSAVTPTHSTPPTPGYAPQAYAVSPPTAPPPHHRHHSSDYASHSASSTALAAAYQQQLFTNYMSDAYHHHQQTMQHHIPPAIPQQNGFTSSSHHSTSNQHSYFPQQQPHYTTQGHDTATYFPSQTFPSTTPYTTQRMSTTTAPFGIQSSTTTKSTSKSSKSTEKASKPKKSKSSTTNVIVPQPAVPYQSNSWYSDKQTNDLYHKQPSVGLPAASSTNNWNSRTSAYVPPHHTLPTHHTGPVASRPASTNSSTNSQMMPHQPAYTQTSKSMNTVISSSSGAYHPTAFNPLYGQHQSRYPSSSTSYTPYDTGTVSSNAYLTKMNNYGVPAPQTQSQRSSTTTTYGSTIVTDTHHHGTSKGSVSSRSSSASAYAPSSHQTSHSGTNTSQQYQQQSHAAAAVAAAFSASSYSGQSFHAANHAAMHPAAVAAAAFSAATSFPHPMSLMANMANNYSNMSQYHNWHGHS